MDDGKPGKREEGTEGVGSRQKAVGSEQPTTDPQPPIENRKSKIENPSPIEEYTLVNLLDSLVEKSLVVYEEDSNGQGRYRLLETVRQYAMDRPLERAGTDALRKRHRDFYLALAESAQHKMAGPEAAPWLERLETEHDNLRAVMAWCLDSPGGAEAGLRLASALDSFWNIRAHFQEGRDYLKVLLACPESQKQTIGRAKAVSVAAMLAYRQCDLDAARAYYEEALAIRRQLGEKSGIAVCLGGLANIANDLGDYPEARRLYAEALSINREVGHRGGVASNLLNMGIAFSRQNDLESARPLYEEARAIYEELGNHRQLIYALNCLGYATSRQGNDISAQLHYGQSLGLCRELGDRMMTTENLEGLAYVAHQTARHERAARLLAAAASLREKIGTPIPPSERADYEHLLQEVRAVLGETAFTDAWNRGAALVWEEAIQNALSEEGEPA